MIHLKAQFQSARIFDSCETCCCEQISVKHMSSEQIIIDFSPWSAPIAPRGLGKTKIHTMLLSKETPSPSYIVQTSFIKGSNGVKINETPSHVEYEYISQIPSKNVVSSDGVVEWKSYSKDEWFYSKNFDWSAKDLYLATYLFGSDKKDYTDIEHELLRVTTSLIDRHVLLLNVWLTPFAYIDSVIRLYVQQYAEDCDCNIYVKDLCIDVTVVKC